MEKQTVVRITVKEVSNNNCPIFRTGDVIYIKKHCFDLGANKLEKYCFHSLSDLYEVFIRVRKKEVGNKERFKCRDNNIVEFELERLPDECYSYER